MAHTLNSAELVKTIKRRANIPAAQVTFTEDDFLALANDEMDMALIPYVKSFHEEYFVYVETIDLVGSQNNYQIPYRAIGNALRDIMFQDTNGNLYEMTRISPEMVYQDAITSSSNTLNKFYLQGSEIIVFPSPTASVQGKLRVSYFLRPNTLVKDNRVSYIAAINTLTGELTLNTAPTNFSVSEDFDFIQARSPHVIKKFDVTPTAYNSITKVITFNPADLPSNLAVGDVIALAGETNIPNIPTDLHSMLAQRVVARCLEAIGDREGLAAANAKIAEMEDKGGSLIDTRVEGAIMKVQNPHGFLRSRKFFRRRGV